MVDIKSFVIRHRPVLMASITLFALFALQLFLVHIGLLPGILADPGNNPGPWP
jgi:hypothetical protein